MLYQNDLGFFTVEHITKFTRVILNTNHEYTEGISNQNHIWTQAFKSCVNSVFRMLWNHNFKSLYFRSRHHCLMTKTADQNKRVNNERKLIGSISTELYGELATERICYPVGPFPRIPYVRITSRCFW